MLGHGLKKNMKRNVHSIREDDRILWNVLPCEPPVFFPICGVDIKIDFRKTIFLEQGSFPMFSYIFLADLCCILGPLVFFRGFTIKPTAVKCFSRIASL